MNFKLKTIDMLKLNKDIIHVISDDEISFIKKKYNELRIYKILFITRGKTHFLHQLIQTQIDYNTFFEELSIKYNIPDDFHKEIDFNKKIFKAYIKE